MPKFIFINSEVVLTFEEQSILALFTPLTFENLDPLSLQFNTVQFENQDIEFIPNNFTQLTFENQNPATLPDNLQSLTFENQDNTIL